MAPILLGLSGKGFFKSGSYIPRLLQELSAGSLIGSTMGLWGSEVWLFGV